jgi:hypothetical protein
MSQHCFNNVVRLQFSAFEQSFFLSGAHPRIRHLLRAFHRFPRNVFLQRRKILFCYTFIERTLPECLDI